MAGMQSLAGACSQVASALASATASFGEQVGGDLKSQFEAAGVKGDEYREILVLRDIQGFSYDEIRNILKIPDGTVKSRLFRARDGLKDCLKKVLAEGSGKLF